MFFAAIVEEPDLMRNAIVTTGIWAVINDVMINFFGFDLFMTSDKGPFINDITLIMDFSDPPPPSSQKC